jgi:ribose transport system ATP-binding protein
MPSLRDAAAGPAPILEMRGISKTFPGVKALNNVQVTVYAGEVHALMGENGAGKSTLMKILSGAYTSDPGGEIRVNGQPVHITGPLSAKAHGIAIIYQELSLAPNLTVAENIYLGRDSGARRGAASRSIAAACSPAAPTCWRGSAPPSARARWLATCRSPSGRWWKWRAPSTRIRASW